MGSIVTSPLRTTLTTADADGVVLAALAAVTGDAIVLLDAELRVRRWAGGAEAIFGWSEAEAVGHPVLEVLRSPCAPGLEGELRARLGQGETARFRSLGRHRDGAELSLQGAAAPLPGGPGPLARALLVVRDVTREARLGEELARLRDRADGPFESAGLGHWLWNVATGALSYDRVWPERLGYGPGEIAPTLAAWTALADPADVERVRGELVAHLRGDVDGIDCEYRLRGKDGRWRWIHLRGRVAVRDGAGRAVHVMGTQTDVTRRREPDERVRAALEANQRLVAELRDALARVKTLSGLLPVCAWCKRIRDDAGYWQRLETYLSEHSGATFTHGMCPECQAREFAGGDGDER